MNQINRIFETSNFYLSAFLLANGLIMLGIERTNSGKGSFVFQDQDSRTGFVDQFLYGQPSVDVRKLIAAIRQLKSGLYDGP